MLTAGRFMYSIYHSPSKETLNFANAIETNPVQCSETSTKKPAGKRKKWETSDWSETVTTIAKKRTELWMPDASRNSQRTKINSSVRTTTPISSCRRKNQFQWWERWGKSHSNRQIYTMGPNGMGRRIRGKRNAEYRL